MDATVRTYLDQYGVSDATRRFLDKPQKMFIGGAWVDSSNGATFDVFEPSTGGLITRGPSGTVEDLDRAVAAARAQFDGGEWRRLKPLERERMLHRLADLIEAHADELAEIEAVDMGKSVTFAREIDIQGTIDTFRYFAGWPSWSDESTLAVLAVVGAVVYGGVVLALFGPRWLAALRARKRPPALLPSPPGD